MVIIITACIKISVIYIILILTNYPDNEATFNLHFNFNIRNSNMIHRMVKFSRLVIFLLLQALAGGNAMSQPGLDEKAFTLEVSVTGDKD
jgi:hypothetical protein